MRRRIFLGCAAALAIAVAPGCGKEKLTTVAVPEAGVSLRYDLEPGLTYDGHFSVRTSLSTPLGEVVSRLEYDVAMSVVRPTDSGVLVNLTVAKPEFTQRLPDGMPTSVLDEQGFNATTAASLDGIGMGFQLSERGDLTELPEPPTEGSPGLQAMVGMVLAGVRTGIVRVPEPSIAEGETWDAVDPSTLTDGESAEGTGRLDGLGRHEDGRDLAQLTFEYAQSGTQPTPIGRLDYTTDAKVEALFAVADGYPTHVEGQLKQEVRGQSSGLEIDARWTKRPPG